jgi:hypothetical protein
MYVYRLCTHAVVLSVKNISPTEPITFYLDAMKYSSQALEGHLHQHHSRSAFLWSGVSRFSTVTLAPRGEISYTLYASFSRSGVYNINRFRLVVTDAGDGPATPHKDVYPTAQYFITVVDEAAV